MLIRLLNRRYIVGKYRQIPEVRVCFGLRRARPEKDKASNIASLDIFHHVLSIGMTHYEFITGVSLQPMYIEFRIVALSLPSI